MTKLVRLPEVLVLCVKRFVDPERVSRDEVRPCESLTFGPRLAYRLSAVACHSGSQSGGHYVTCARRPGSGEWHLHDDARTVMLGGARDTCPRQTWRSGYLFVYCRVGGTAP